MDTNKDLASLIIGPNETKTPDEVGKFKNTDALQTHADTLNNIIDAKFKDEPPGTGKRSEYATDQGTETALLEALNRLREEKEKMTDDLTGLLNRKGISKFADEMMAHSSRANESLVVALVDFDHFKNINDKYGHDVGDEALTAAARLMEGELRKADLIGRYGGEEFLIILPKTNIEEASNTLERLREKTEKNLIHDINGIKDKTVPQTVSIGFAEFDPKNPEGFTQIVKKADDALYVAKGKQISPNEPNSGRNRIIPWGSAIENSISVSKITK